MLCQKPGSRLVTKYHSRATDVLAVHQPLGNRTGVDNPPGVQSCAASWPTNIEYMYLLRSVERLQHQKATNKSGTSRGINRPANHMQTVALGRQPPERALHPQVLASQTNTVMNYHSGKPPHPSSSSLKVREEIIRSGRSRSVSVAQYILAISVQCRCNH